MSNWMELTEEEERSLLRWILNELVHKMKEEEKPGDQTLKYFTKIKLQKILFLVTEECQFNITRLWYKYGGYVPAPFDVWDQILKFFSKKDKIFPPESSIIKTKFKGKLTQIQECLESIYTKIYRTKTEDFLDEFYVEKAPRPYREAYQSVRRMKTDYKFIISSQQTIDSSLQSLLPTYDQWRMIYLFQNDITQFHLDISPFIPELVLEKIIEFTDLLERALLNYKWKQENNKPVKSEEIDILQRMELNFDRKIWGLIALYIGIDTVKGVRAEQIKTEFLERIETELKDIGRVIQDQKMLLVTNDMMPTYKVLNEYFNAKYKDRYKELVREGNKWLMNN